MTNARSTKNKLPTAIRQIKDLTDKNAKLEHAIANLIEKRKDEPGSFEVADGRISWVNQNGTVWINLGTADSLRRQVTFSVFDADLHDAAKASKKGSIEVTRLLGDHMAEARITNDDPTNPILTGDNIYSQIWHRGKKLHFALTGVIDIDGDGQSDMQLARDLIELNGGVVDAYLDDDGKVQGEITANTRYLVSGEAPEKSASRSRCRRVRTTCARPPRRWVSRRSRSPSFSPKWATSRRTARFNWGRARRRAIFRPGPNIRTARPIQRLGSGRVRRPRRQTATSK